MRPGQDRTISEGQILLSFLPQQPLRIFLPSPLWQGDCSPHYIDRIHTESTMPENTEQRTHRDSRHETYDEALLLLVPILSLLVLALVIHFYGGG